MRRRGFSLVKLIVAIVVVGILAVIAAPKLFTSQAASDKGLRQTLSAVRDAIERYTAQHNGQLPGADGLPATFKADLSPYIRDLKIDCPVGPARNRQVKMSNGPGPITGQANPLKGWHYNYQTGEFIVNFSGLSSDGVTPYDGF